MYHDNKPIKKFFYKFDKLFMSTNESLDTMNPTAIIQVRTGSSRLPGKILNKLNGITVLECFFEQLKYSKSLKDVVIATTLNSKDEIIVDFAKENHIEFFRGSETDVLDRFYNCAKKFAIYDIVRMTPDCPLIDPNVVDKVINFYKNNKFDFVSNTLQRTFPYGNDVEVFSFTALETAWKNAKKPSEREHVTPFIYNNPNLFSIAQIKNSETLTRFHWTLDRKEDLMFIRAIYQKISRKPIFIEDILEILKKNPEFLKINKNTVSDEGYQKSLRGDVA